MTKIIRLDDGTKYVANLKKDVCLYSAPVNPPNTGTNYTSGTDLYVHETKNHGPQFYKYGWSMWQGVNDHIEPVSKEEAEAFLESRTNDYNGFPDDSDVELIKQYGIDLSEETA